MNEQSDKLLHDWVRQSMADYEPAVDAHEAGEDWQLLRPRLFPRRRRPVLWLWATVLVGLVGGMGLYWLYSERAKMPSTAVKTAILSSEQPVITTSPLPETPAVLPERTPVPEGIVAPRRVARRGVRAVSVPPAELPASPKENVADKAPAWVDLMPLTGRAVEMVPRTWPVVANQILSPSEQALETTLLSGEIGADSTVFAALSRNLQQWPNAVIVCDLTTSMDPYAAQIYAWFRRNAKNPNVSGVVFFTDCDSLGQQTRPNGPPGAFFTTRERDPRAALPTLLAAARNTKNNRDGDENVVEALRYAQRTFPRARHLVLLADNGSGVKDMPLLAGLKKPVHIIACGDPLNNVTPFQGDHYQIAQQTGGSIHTLEDDVEPNQLSRGTFVRVGNYYYRYSPRKNRFVKTRFERRPVRVLGVRL